MDILTPKGQATIEKERRAIEIWLKHFPTYLYIETPKNEPAIIDAVLSVDGVMQAAVETKCRDFTLEEFRGKYNSEALIDHQKLINASNIAAGLCVPLAFFVYLVPDDELLYELVWHPKDGWLRQMSIKQIWTQASVNGGKVKKSCAFIDMRDAKILKGK